MTTSDISYLIVEELTLMFKHPVVIGLLCGFVILSVVLVIGGQPGIYIHATSFLIVLGGTFSALIVSTSWQNLRNLPKVLYAMVQPNLWQPEAIIDVLVRFAEKARREGLLALEDEVLQLDDKFLEKGVQLVVDGTDAELVKNILETELSFVEDRHLSGRGMFETMGAFSPAFGMIGTLIGLIAMLDQLEDPASIGAGMATALITTLYGTLFANLVFNPIARQLTAISKQEVLLKEVMIEGILSIQAGENPRIVEQKLKAFLSPARKVVEHGTVEDDELVVDAGVQI